VRRYARWAGRRSRSRDQGRRAARVHRREVDVRPRLDLPDASAFRGHTSTTSRSPTRRSSSSLDALRARFGTLTGVTVRPCRTTYVVVDLSATVDGKDIEEARHLGAVLPDRLRWPDRRHRQALTGLSARRVEDGSPRSLVAGDARDPRGRGSPRRCPPSNGGELPAMEDEPRFGRMLRLHAHALAHRFEVWCGRAALERGSLQRQMAKPCSSRGGPKGPRQGARRAAAWDATEVPLRAG